MANYSIKLSDHTASPNSLAQDIQATLQKLYDRVFKGTSDKATVAWGAASASDRIVLHFVESVANSYIAQKMARPPKINSLAGGHTTKRGHLVCSEFYKTVSKSDSSTRTFKAQEAAKLAFHESLHNMWPDWTEQDLMGHGGLADTPVGPDLNQWDIDTVIKGIAASNKVKQQL
jgi:hypothetical protein